MKKQIFILLAFAMIFAGCESLQLVNPEIPIGEYNEAESKNILDQVNSLEGEPKACLDSFINEYQKGLFEYCEATEGGENIGGGCAHVAYAWSITTSVLEAGLANCTRT
ncbi:putative integron gene cassette protein [Alteromonas sp. 38]|uniref:hypothetical protein n=1 Tax=unclassified Alteromonas TaxID=2614992 RepID=UPI0012F344F1|nr:MULTISPECIES: hypothetical protein [unclassified Alteromonas]CAD5271185.1 putative integron gene cassette protein [Alteromonas sp. 154]VXB91629.1 putative integron gene cassette protein [Alteromonas sp. 38]